jgi:hypothetical protein
MYNLLPNKRSHSEIVPALFPTVDNAPYILDSISAFALDKASSVIPDVPNSSIVAFTFASISVNNFSKLKSSGGYAKI